MRPLRAVVAAAAAVGAVVAAALFGQPAAGAATQQVNIQNMAFSPTPLTVAQGDTVTWTNLDGFDHTVTSNQRFWAKATLSSGGEFSQTAAFMNAGGYGYHCSIHPDMTGVVRVKLIVTTPAAGGWRLRWSRLLARPTSRNFDVEIMRPGSDQWRWFRRAVTSRYASFDPATQGTYSFRARTRIISSGNVSGWSPVRHVSVG